MSSFVSGAVKLEPTSSPLSPPTGSLVTGSLTVTPAFVVQVKGLSTEVSVKQLLKEVQALATEKFSAVLPLAPLTAPTPLPEQEGKQRLEEAEGHSDNIFTIFNTDRNALVKFRRHRFVSFECLLVVILKVRINLLLWNEKPVELLINEIMID